MTTKTAWWNEAPFLRLLPLLMTGIAAGWYLKFSLFTSIIVLACCTLIIISYLFLPLGQKHRWRWISGAALLGIIASMGAALVWQANITNDKSWFGHDYNPGDGVVAIVDEPLVPKPASYKTVLRITHVVQNNKQRPVTGSAIVYFQKSAVAKQLQYGSRIVLRKTLMPVTNSGNPGAFDYRRYMLFQSITHQVYLSQSDFVFVDSLPQSWLQHKVVQSRAATVRILQTHIGGAKEQGLAQALLIGYKDDLDKTLVEAYTNTGVVHVIAISGLHLGIIYMMLLFLLRPIKQFKLVYFLLTVAGLWGFSLLAGAQPSVLRSAAMFSCLALGEVLGRKSSTLNTLAFSAFGLLLYNPFWLWDLGFQLSYAAVGGIIVFYKPLYHLLYFPNKAIDWVWKLIALTLTAQIFTLPISLYHFHQFPILFLVTNLVAVPLSSIILIGEIILSVFSFWPLAANAVGSVVEEMITWLNHFITRLNALSFAVWDGFSLSSLQVVLLFVAISSFGAWLLAKNRSALQLALCCMLVFVSLRTVSFYKAGRQRQLIVYNVPKHRAVDVVAGRQVYFWGDSILLQEGVERNFHLKPARILLKAAEIQPIQAAALSINDKTIARLDSTLVLPSSPPAVLIVSGRAILPKHHFTKDRKPQVVLEATVPPWRVKEWKRLCAAVSWPVHSVKEDGAFQMRW